ncbi:unnamed protein product [Euphydryas editha]|uniref:Uncharacterized protein n=1 Tax=Euphydryas editha TaxID=104508 RepID=A0AAU9TJS1_EUPED|nr:unnamed protein product [Euphydryas editha]
MNWERSQGVASFWKRTTEIRADGPRLADNNPLKNTYRFRRLLDHLALICSDGPLSAHAPAAPERTS